MRANGKSFCIIPWSVGPFKRYLANVMSMLHMANYWQPRISNGSVTALITLGYVAEAFVLQTLNMFTAEWPELYLLRLFHVNVASW